MIVTLIIMIVLVSHHSTEIQITFCLHMYIEVSQYSELLEFFLKEQEERPGHLSTQNAHHYLHSGK